MFLTKFGKKELIICVQTNSFRNRKKGIIKIDNFLDINEIKKISKIIKYYSAPKNTPESYFPTNFSNGVENFKFKFY